MTSAKKTSDLDKPNIFDYHDYREFLKDWLGHLKRSPHSLSLRAIAGKSGYSVSQISMVLSGQRVLTKKAMAVFLPHLKLSSKEVKVFQHLRELTEGETQWDREKAYRKLKKYDSYRSRHGKDWEVHRLLSHWYVPAIRELAHLGDFQEDAVWIQTRLKYKVSRREIQKALDFLFKQGYLARTDEGGVEIPDKLIECSHGIYKLAMAGFHRQMLERAVEAIDITPSENRNLVTHTMSVKKENVEELKKIVDETLKKIQQLGEQDQQGDDVYQVSLLAFPLTKSSNKGES